MNLQRHDLRTLITIVDNVINGAPVKMGERELVDLRQRMAHVFASYGPEWGEKVFEWRIALVQEVFPTRGKNKGKAVRKKRVATMNELVNLNIWAKQELREWLDADLLKALERWPLAVIQDEPRPRAVRVTRCSSKQPDEMGVDVLGGKVPVDRMVQAGILAGDTVKLLQREARWQQAPKEEGLLLIEVFELKGATT
jgi:hypothetical protein